MGKAILVIDEMPETCGKCRLLDFGKCWGSASYLPLSTKVRPKECPLRPLPERMTADLYYKKTPYICNWEERSYGWNDCLDEILGEVKDE